MAVWPPLPSPSFSHLVVIPPTKAPACPPRSTATSLVSPQSRPGAESDLPRTSARLDPAIATAQGTATAATAAKPPHRHPGLDPGSTFFARPERCPRGLPMSALDPLHTRVPLRG